MNKYFPINTETACPLKWNWSTLYLYSGQTASCHRTGWGNITLENFDSFHNTDKKIQERQQMLNGHWPTESCAYCKGVEEVGGTSDRMFHLKIPNQVPVELDLTPNATSVTPTTLEVYFNNTCNLSCVYCVPDLSSKINQEYKKFGDFDCNGVKLSAVAVAPDHRATVDKFWQWMEKNSSKLKRLNVLGGEPFYQSEFDECFNFFDAKAHPDLEWGIVTNLMVSEETLEVYINKFKKLLATKKLKRIDITCSIDCFGLEQEYVRHGLKLSTWKKNFERLLKEKWLTININQTITVLTIKTMPDLLEYINQCRQQRSIGHYFSVATPQPTYLVPSIMGNIFEQDFEKILQLMPDSINKEHMEGIAKESIQATVNSSELLKLKTFLDENDRRRNTNWKTTFPWLDKELLNVV